MNMLSLRINSSKANGTSDRSAQDVFVFPVDDTSRFDSGELLISSNDQQDVTV